MGSAPHALSQFKLRNDMVALPHGDKAPLRSDVGCKAKRTLGHHSRNSASMRSGSTIMVPRLGDSLFRS